MTTETVTRQVKLNKVVTLKRWGERVEVSAKVGSWVCPDEQPCGMALIPCNEEPCPGWDGADFRLPLNLCDLAVNVFVTGRTVQTRDGFDMVRVRIEAVGDCEPSTFFSGWMGFDSANQDFPDRC